MCLVRPRRQIGFGSNFIVIKKKEWTPGDGMFFQFNMVVGVFITGLLYHFFVRHAPPLQPIAMIGGAGWAIGNACCPCPGPPGVFKRP